MFVRTHVELLAVAAAALAATGCAGVSSREASFPFGGQTITVERFDPVGETRPKPAVLLFHGADGPDRFGDRYRQLAGYLAGRGYAVLFVHYLDRTGHRFATVDLMRLHRFDWTETIAEAVRYARSQPDIDPDRVGIVGFSLGAITSIPVAARPYMHVAAVVDFFGAAAPEVRDRMEHFPPTLIIHGQDDPTVPVAEAHKLDAKLTELGVPHELRVYPDEVHILRKWALIDAVLRAADFLDRHVRDRTPTPPRNALSPEQL